MKDLREYGTFEIEKDEQNVIHVHCVLKQKNRISDETIRVNTGAVYKWLVGLNYDVDSCLKVDSANNKPDPVMGAHGRTAHWTFKLKPEPKKRTYKRKTTTSKDEKPPEASSEEE